MVCNKTTYDSYDEAKRAVNSFKRNRRSKNSRSKSSNKIPKRVYKCDQCGKYHMTSQKKKR